MMDQIWSLLKQKTQFTSLRWWLVSNRNWSQHNYVFFIIKSYMHNFAPVRNGIFRRPQQQHIWVDFSFVDVTKKLPSKNTIYSDVLISAAWLFVQTPWHKDEKNRVKKFILPLTTNDKTNLNVLQKPNISKLLFSSWEKNIDLTKNSLDFFQFGQNIILLKGNN